MAAIRSSVFSPKRAVRKLMSCSLRARIALSSSPSRDAISNGSWEASARRPMLSSAERRRSGSGSDNWNCTRAEPITRRTPPLGRDCVNPSEEAVVSSPVSTSVRARVSSVSMPIKNSRVSSFCQMLRSAHCSRKPDTCGSSEATRSSMRGPTELRDGFATSST